MQGKIIIILVTKLNFHAMENPRSQDKGYNINVHCGKKNYEET